MSSSAPGSGTAGKSGPNRRAAILAAARELFGQRGFHGVGIDEIGMAAGITGPGVYRHFPSKDSLLVALFDDVSEQMLESMHKIVAQLRAPWPTLERMVSLHVSFAADKPGVLTVILQDWRSLPDDAQARVSARYQEYMGYLEATLGAARPELTEGERELIAYAAAGAVNSVAFHNSGLPAEPLAAHLRRIAMAVLESG